jgi:hypothetical protein
MDEDRTAGGTKLIFCIYCRMWVDGIVFAWASANMGGFHLAGVPFARKRSLGALSIFSSAQKAKQRYRMLDG